MHLTIVDDFAAPGLIEAARATWPDERWPHWHRYTGEHGDKLASKDADRLPAACRLLVARMAELAVPAGCFPDLDLHGAGMHWLRRGARLPRHLDAQRHPLLGWRRRFNAILYLDTCSGGDLRLEHQGREVAVQPRVNRLAMFAADPPHEVTEVTDGDRRSLSLFWWSEPNEPQPANASEISARWGAAV